MEAKKIKRKNKVGEDTDILARTIYNALVRDFTAVHENFHFREFNFESGTLEEFRYNRSYDYSSTSPARFKAYAQVESLLKKYRFKADVFTDAQLEDRSYGDYFDSQQSFLSVPHSSASIHLVLQEARKLAKQILGKFNPEYMSNLCRFGANSSIGCPLVSAYLDIKLSERAAFTGSRCVSRWFYNDVLTKDTLLGDVLSACHKDGLPSLGAPTLNTESLVLQDVPKSWKILRIITPLALLNLFYSNGLGEYVAEQLSINAGLRISTLQRRHRRLVERMSVDKKHATVDLSKASDSITSWLLNRILPRDWYNALKPILTHKIEKDGKEYYTNSVLPMGNGATFPLETLIFYCIVKAVGHLAGIRGIYSVYGDDIIYPSRLHHYMPTVFEKLGLKMNLDKTYVRCNFRESCGSDFYHGIDVRPFFLGGEHRVISKRGYAVECYKALNGLLARWDQEEIPQTIQSIISEILRVDGFVMRVPPNEPDTAGLKVKDPKEDLGLPPHYFLPVKVFTTHCQVLRATEPKKFGKVSLKVQCNTPEYHYFRYTDVVRYRRVKTQFPYYWEKMRAAPPPYDFKLDLKPQPSKILSRINQLYVESTGNLSWQIRKRRVKRTSKEGRTWMVVVRKATPYVALKNVHGVNRTTGSVTDWA